MAPPTHPPEALTRHELRRIAARQRGVLVSIFGYVLTLLAQFVLPPEYELVCIVAGIAIAIGAAVCVFLLGRMFHSPVVSVLLVILTLIPLVGLCILMVVDRRASGILKGHGIHVGLLGADVRSI